jgi:flagellar biosynthesis regulator FlaF
MFARWWKEFDGAVSERAGVDPSPLTALQAHIDVTRAATENVTDRTASLMAALLQIDAQRQTTRDWYRVRMNLADPSTAEGKRLRLALLATEGAFLLRSLDLLRMDETEWHAIFGDIQAVLLAP